MTRARTIGLAATNLFVALSISDAAWAANTYVETLKEGVDARIEENNHPNVSDELERSIVTCLLDAFVAANIPADDLAKLDRAVAAGTIESDPLAAHYKILANDPAALAPMSQEATRRCPDVLKSYADATN